MPKKASGHTRNMRSSKARTEADEIQAAKDSANEKAKRDGGSSRRMSMGKKIAVGIFSLFIALSMMIPSLAMIFGRSNSQTTVTKTSSSKSGQEASTPDAVNAKYSAQAQELSDEITDNPDNLAAVLKLAQTHLNWGVELRKIASDDTVKQQADEYITKSLSEYDTYLAKSDSDEVRADRAIAQFQSGDENGSVEALKALTGKSPDCALAWLNLGMVYLKMGNADDADAALQKAVEADADGSQNVRSIAQKLLDAK